MKMGSTYKMIFAIALLLLCKSAFSQDPQFTQFYSAPLYLGPSFAGGTDGSRVAMNFRNQWPFIKGMYMTTSLSLDHYFHNIKSGAGLLVVADQAGTSRLRNMQLQGQYSYQFQLNRNLYIRPGIGMAVGYRTIDASRLVFASEIDDKGDKTDIIDPNRANISGDQDVYPDANTGLLVFMEKFWGGFTIDHLLRPKQTFMGNNGHIPIKYSFYGGSKLLISGKSNAWDEQSFTFSALYKMQGRYDQFDIGTYWYRVPLILGLRYRGLPFIKQYDKGLQNNESVILVVGLKEHWYQIGYSYDITVSRLTTPQSGGAHEVTAVFLFNQGAPAKKRVVPPCPHF